MALWRTLNPERCLELKIILNAFRKMSLCLGVEFVGFISKQIKFLLCDMNGVTIPHALCIEKKHCVLGHQFQRRVIWIQKTTV